MTVTKTMLYHYAECHILSMIMLNVIILNVIILNVIILNDAILNVIMLSVTMLSVTLLNVTILFTKLAKDLDSYAYKTLPMHMGKGLQMKLHNVTIGVTFVICKHSSLFLKNSLLRKPFAHI